LAHYREYRLSPSAVALYYTLKLGAPIRRHAKPIDDDVTNLVLAIACAQAPIDFERLNRLVRAAKDLAGDDRAVLIEPATGGSGANGTVRSAMLAC
jgi:hypothetical protein